MKINLITTAFIALGLASSSATFAASTNTPITDHMVITADRTIADQYLALSSTQIIDKSDIERIQPHNVTELLDQVAGISVVKQGGGGQKSSVFMRGTKSAHTLILVDGVRISSATLGSTSFSSIAVANIERIEIVKGPRAALWGSDAIGGVIQIFTKQSANGEGSISAGFGSHGLWKTAGSVGFGDNVNSMTLNASVEQSNGFSATNKSPAAYEDDNDGFKRYAFGIIGKSQYNDQISMHLVSNVERGEAEYDPLYSKDFQSSYENHLIRVAGQYQGDKLFTEVSVATSQNQMVSYAVGSSKSTGDELATSRDQISLLSQYQMSAQTSLTTGFDWYNEKVSTTKDKNWQLAGFQSYDVDSRNVKAGYLQLQYHVGGLLLEGAIRRDFIENLAPETTYNASVGYQINDAWLVSLNRATAFKAPSFNDLYWPGAGDPTLLPENITSNELLIRNKFENGTLELSVFESDIENLIAWAPQNNEVWLPSNINNAEIKGIELSLSVSTGAVSHQLALAYIDAKDSDQNIPLARRPELTGNYTIGYQWDKFTVTTNISYRDESADKLVKNSDILDDYWLTDLALSYQATSKLQLSAKVNNVFDTEYETAKTYLSDGVNYVVNVTYQF